MRIVSWLSVHRWAGFGAALFLLAWIVSGVVLLLPGSSAAPAGARGSSSHPAAEMTVSPSEAVGSLERVAEGRSVRLRSIRLHRVGDRPAYRIVTREGRIHLVDAGTGEEFQVTREMAVHIATDAYPEVSVDHVKRIDSHGLAYPYGPLPVFRVVFEDGDGTWAYVSGTDGSLSWSDREGRIRAGIVAFHEFSFLPPLPGGGKLRWLLLVVGVVASTGVLLTGVYLFYVWWVRIRRAGR